MHLLKYFILLSVTQVLVACAGNGTPLSSAECTNPTNLFVGKYRGKEVLEGGIFPITIKIGCDGKIRVIDVDGRVAVGELEGAQFIARRGGNAPQVFTGEISGNQAVGTTKDNPFLGSGTFSATLSP